jgi:hypothetical protein
MVPDVSTGDTHKMLCLNCARKVVSPKPMGKYDGLRNHLKFRAAFTDTVRLSFAQIDGILRDNLPMSAYKSEKWWSNSPDSTHAKAWLDVGWKAQEVDLKNGYVTFQKVKDLHTRAEGKRRRASQDIKPFTPVPVKLPKSKVPSKTKIAKLYARIKNIERQKTTMPKYPGSFRPKPTHEKRLFKPNEKPQ